MKIETLILFLLPFLFFLGCKEPSQPVIVTEEVVIPESFVEFYDRFHTDSLFQLNHIVFPLQGKVDTIGSQLKWSKNEWKLHKPFETFEGSYNRDYSVLNGIVIEHVQDIYGYFNMERRFTIMADEWNLIYYRVIYNDKF